MHLTNMKWFLGVLFALLSLAPAKAAPHTKATLFLSHASAAPGSTVTAAIHLKMDQGWHTYWRNPGGPGIATKIAWDLPEGITAGEIQWPIPEKYKLDDFFNYVYHDEAVLIVALQIGANVAAGPKPIKAKVRWLECETSCIPGSGNVEGTLEVGSERLSSDAPKFEDWKKKLPKKADGIEVTAKWDGPDTAEERPIIFTVNKPAGAWDFFNYPGENFKLVAKTEPLPAQAGNVSFRKIATKSDGDWPKEIPGLVLIPGEPNSAGEITVKFETTQQPTPTTTTTQVAKTPAAANPTQTANPTLIAILGLAFLGGLILNIMPCVLPVIALKILGFVRQANDDPKRIRKLGLIYAGGVIASFMALATFVLAIKQAGKAASWGMQFQNPGFVVFITTLVVLVALNLFGVFEVTLGGKAMDAAGGLASKEGSSGAFFNGVLATILATPCTAPFLAPALGFAFAASTQIILLVFLAIALGLATPYVVLCWFPAWLKKLPKPGAWMEKFKIAMGFPMLATAVWLFSVAIAHFGKSGALSLGLFLVMIGFAAWIFGEFVQRGSRRRGLAAGVAGAIALGSCLYLSANLRADSSAIAWRSWSPAAVQEVRAKGQAVLVDFTADWCLTCQVNKKTSIEIASVREKIKTLNIAAFRADNTSENPEIVKELEKYQRAGVPLVLVFPADPEKPPIVLPEVLTPSLVLDALQKAAK